MDEIKLVAWKKRFEQEVKCIQTEYNSYFLNNSMEELYTINLDESNEWDLRLSAQLPKEIKDRLMQIFLSAKPEDSV